MNKNKIKKQTKIKTIERRGNMEFENEDIISKIYEAQENKLDEIIKEKSKEIQGNLNNIEFEEITEENKKEIFSKIEENCSIKIASFTREFYKQGFMDGVNLMISCLK